jgi:O-antigen/teichoic acid export membrane protein
MASRSQKALLGLVTDFGGMSALIIVTFIATPIILELTSETLYGFWITTISILGYLALTDLGIGMSLTQLISANSSKGNSSDLNKIISTAFIVFCGLALIFFISGISLTSFIPVWFKIPEKESALVISAYKVAIISGALALPLSIFNSVVVGYQQMAVMNVSKNIVSIIGVIFSIILLKIDIGLVALPLATLFVVITNSIIAYIYSKKYFKELKISYSSFDLKVFKKLLSFGGYFQLGRVANTVALSTDNIVISIILGAGSVTPYAFTSKLPILFSVALASKLPVAIFPAMTEMFANNEIEKLREIYKRLTYFAVRIALIGATLLFIVNFKFVELWVGPEYYGGNFLNFVFVLMVIIDTVYRGTTAIVYASGDLKKWTIASILEAILNIIITLILIKPYGLAGVALGTLISKILTTGFYTPYWVCKKLKISINSLFKNSIISPLIRSIPSFVLTILISDKLQINNGWIWIVVTTLILIITNILMFEGVALSRNSNDSIIVRLKRLILMQERY